MGEIELFSMTAIQIHPKILSMMEFKAYTDKNKCNNNRSNGTFTLNNVSISTIEHFIYLRKAVKLKCFLEINKA